MSVQISVGVPILECYGYILRNGVVVLFLFILRSLHTVSHSGSTILYSQQQWFQFLHTLTDTILLIVVILMGMRCLHTIGGHVIKHPYRFRIVRNLSEGCVSGGRQSISFMANMFIFQHFIFARWCYMDLEAMIEQRDLRGHLWLSDIAEIIALNWAGGIILPLSK